MQKILEGIQSIKIKNEAFKKDFDKLKEDVNVKHAEITNRLEYVEVQGNGSSIQSKDTPLGDGSPSEVLSEESLPEAHILQQ